MLARLLEFGRVPSELLPLCQYLHQLDAHDLAIVVLLCRYHVIGALRHLNERVLCRYRHGRHSGKVAVAAEC